MTSLRRPIVAVLCAFAVVCSLATPALSATTRVVNAAPTLRAPTLRAPSPGAAGAGDPYFPRQGNGGYDVGYYGLSISYTPAGRKLSGVAHIHAHATQNLSRFDLDLRRSLTVSSVFVNGRRATFSQPSAQVQELVITPARPVAKGARLRVDVRYAGVAKAVTDADGSLDGFIPTADGAFVASEPQGSPTWFPVNDTPDDKATYAVSITVPKGLTAVSNGVLTGHRTRGALTTWSWHLYRPVSSYLITATLGKFNVSTGRTPAGIPYFIAVDPTQARASKAVLRTLPAIVDYFSKTYGRYPFGRTGAIVDNAPNVGYALETATRPLFDSAPDESTLSHELAHQWYGDAVTLKKWRDIWLNEGFAEFSSWLWDEHTGVHSAAQYLSDALKKPASSNIWNPPPANPGDAADIFDDSVYTRGAATLQALREKLGNRTFFRIMRGWYALHRYGNASVPQFTRYATKVAGRNLDHFFHVWLYAKGKPGTRVP